MVRHVQYFTSMWQWSGCAFYHVPHTIAFLPFTTCLHVLIAALPRSTPHGLVRVWPEPGKEPLEDVDRTVHVAIQDQPTVRVPTAVRPLPQGHVLPSMTPAALLGRVPLSNRLQVLPSVPTLVGEHQHKAIQAPVIEDRPIAIAVLLLVGLGNHLPLGEIANHHGAFNQSVGDEMRGFVQTVTLFVALALRDALINLREVEVAAGFLLAAVPLRTNRVELAVVPVVALEATDRVDAPLLVHARCQRLDAQVNGEQTAVSLGVI